MQQDILDDGGDDFYLDGSDLTIFAPRTYDQTAEYNLNFFGGDNDDTDQMIDGIDLENDEDVANYLGAMLDG